MSISDNPTGGFESAAAPLIGSKVANAGMASDGIGSVIAGKYKLMELIGQGGMGAVYLAEQTEPVKRQVAIKLIRAGVDSKSVLARFDAERQALALMDHPHIARVYDGGTTPTGMPFFAMELVRGVPITEYCDTQRLSVQARLELFIAVCQAVQHAHQKGIIHRDLKPGNILVAEVDGRPAPKVIDFGLAKATEQKLTELSLVDVGMIVGTASYMSPEQADPSTADIDTRTDVYALGVILYELLTGTVPIEAAQFQRAAVLEMLRMIREDEPPRPSTRLSTAEKRPSIAANRSIEPAQLARILRGELDWVVMKALEKDRSRRYETVNSLAGDVQRYLADEAVEARPPSRAYRLRKFVKRNKAPVASGLLLLTALVGGIVGTSLGLVEARVQRDAATAAAAAENAQRKIAEQANQQAFEALKSFTNEFMEQVLGSRANLTETEKSILRSAQQQWEVFARSKGESAEARVIRSEGAAELALIQYRLGMFADAEANDRAALAIRAGLAADFPTVPIYRLKLGMSHQNLGANLRGSGNRAEAETNFRAAVDVFAQLAAEFPHEPKYSQRQSWSLISLGNAVRARDQWTEAEGHYRDALSIQKRLAAENPGDVRHRAAQADSHWGLAFTLKRMGKPAAAETEYREALTLKEELAAAYPSQATFRHDAANLGRELAILLSDDGRHEAGASVFPKVIQTLEHMAAEFPSIPTYRSDLARSRRDFARVLGSLNKPVQSAEQFRMAIALFEKLVGDHPTVLPYKADLGLSYSYFGEMLCDGDTPAQSLEWYEKAISTLTDAYVQDRKVILTKSALYRCHAGRAEAYARLGKYADAVNEWDKAIELGPASPLPNYRARRAYAKAHVGRLDEAIATLTELTKSEPKDSSHWYTLACVYALASVKNDAKKDEFAKLAVEQLRQAMRVGYHNHELIERDADLAPLRGREDFQALLVELKKMPPEKK